MPVKIAIAVLFATVAVFFLRFGLQMLLRESDPGAILWLSTGTFAAFGALYWMISIRTSEAVAPEASKQPKRNIKRYLMYTSIPAAACATTSLLVVTETIPLTEEFYRWVSFPFGPPAIASMILLNAISEGEIRVLLFQWIFVPIVPFVYFSAVGIPAGQLAGLLPSRASRGFLWMIQFALVALHLWWGYGFLLALKA